MGNLVFFSNMSVAIQNPSDVKAPSQPLRLVLSKYDFKLYKNFFLSMLQDILKGLPEHDRCSVSMETQSAGLESDSPCLLDALEHCLISLVAHGYFKPHAAIVTSEGDLSFISEGDDFDSLCDLLAGREPLIDPESGEEVSLQSLCLTYELTGKAKDELG